MKKISLLSVLLSLLLLSCSKSPAEKGAQNRSNSPTPALPFAVTIVKTPETQEIEDLTVWRTEKQLRSFTDWFQRSRRP